MISGLLKQIPRNLVVALALALMTAFAFAQSDAPTTYEVYGGGSYGRLSNATSENGYGWEVSISQYPYESYRWFGGEIEASGLFTNEVVEQGTATFYQNLYAYMGGPTFAAPARRRVKPYAHVLLGAVVESSYAKGLLANNSGDTGRTDNTMFGTAIGGGFDVLLTHRLAARGVADWLSFRESVSNRIEDLRVSAGIVYKF
jgi:hypothetical protein